MSLKTGNILVAVPLFLAIITLVLIGYFFGVNRSLNNLNVQPEISVPISVISDETENRETPTDTNVESVKLLATNGWVTASNKIFSLKYPEDKFRVQLSDNSTQLIPKANLGDNRLGSPDFVISNGYTGGSRRQSYLDMDSFYPSEILFTQKMAGDKDILEVKRKNESSVTEILLTNGAKILVYVILNGADKQFVETVISTIKFN